MPHLTLHPPRALLHSPYTREYVVLDTAAFPLAHPAISVIIPTFDEQKLIGPFLHQFSLELRRELNLEVIVSDGGSRDATVEIASVFADRVVKFRSTRRQTIAEGRNAGAHAAKGSVLLFFNADVQLPEDVRGFLRSLTTAVLQDGAATCDVAVDPGKATAKDRAILGLCNLVYYSMNVMRLGAGRGECHAVSAEVFRALDGYNDCLVAGEDFELYGRIARYFRRSGSGRIVHVRKWRVYEDPRRYRQSGYVRTLSRWVLNFLAVTFLKRSQSKCWEPVR